MKYLTFLLFCFFFNCICLKVKINNDPPILSIYGESLCPYTLKFISTDLEKLIHHPLRNSLVNDIKIIWFGKEKEKINESGDYTYTCQHGDNECYGNKLLNCMDSHYSIEIKYDFQVCVSKKALKEKNGKSDSHIDFDSIIKSCSITEDFSNSIFDCVKTNGDRVMHNPSEATGSIEHVPYIMINGVYNHEYSDSIRQDLIKFLCSYNKLDNCY